MLLLNSYNNQIELFIQSFFNKYHTHISIYFFIITTRSFKKKTRLLKIFFLMINPWNYITLIETLIKQVHTLATPPYLLYSLVSDMALNLSTGGSPKDTKKWPSRQPVNCQYCGVRISMAFNLRNHVKRCKMRPYNVSKFEPI